MQIRHVLFISLVCITSLHGADSGGSSDGYQTLWGSMVSKFGPALVTGAGFAWQYIQVSASTTTQLATTAWSFVPAQYKPYIIGCACAWIPSVFSWCKEAFNWLIGWRGMRATVDEIYSDTKKHKETLDRIERKLDDNKKQQNAICASMWCGFMYCAGQMQQLRHQLQQEQKKREELQQKQDILYRQLYQEQQLRNHQSIENKGDQASASAQNQHTIQKPWPIQSNASPAYKQLTSITSPGQARAYSHTMSKNQSIPKQSNGTLSPVFASIQPGVFNTKNALRNLIKK